MTKPDKLLIEAVARAIHYSAVEDKNGHWWNECQNVRRDQANAAIKAYESYKESDNG